jgi:hypothetical protein
MGMMTVSKRYSTETAGARGGVHTETREDDLELDGERTRQALGVEEPTLTDWPLTAEVTTTERTG